MALILAFAFAVAVLGGALAVARAARAANVGLPVAVGAALRLAVMLAAHFGSVAAGGRGFMFLDDQGYEHIASLLADRWREGRFVDPASYQFAGSYVFGFPTLVALIFLGTGKSLLAAKLVNVVLGTATIVVTALIGRQLGGERAARYTAWLVAISPTVVWWSAPLLKEALVAFLVAASVLFAFRLPRPRAFAGLMFGLLGLAVTRIPAVLGVGAGVSVAWLAAAWTMRKRVNWSAFAVLGALGGIFGAAALAFVAHGSPVALLTQYASTVRSTTAAYPGGDPRSIPTDVVRTALAPYPWAFDPGTRSWYRSLYPGMWVWYLLLPTAALGLHRLRRHAELWLFAIPISFLVLASALTSGFTIRQRSSIEPLVLVLVVLGVDSWQKVFRRGSAALLAIALFAAAQSQSPAVGIVIAAGACIVFLIAKRLPASSARVDLEPSPVSAGAVALTLPEGVSLAALRARAPAPRPFVAKARLGTIHAAALAVAPPVRSTPIALATRVEHVVGLIRPSIAATRAGIARLRRPLLRALRPQTPAPLASRVPAPIHAVLAAVAPPVRAASIGVGSRIASAAHRFRTGAGARALRPAGAGRSVLRTLRAHAPPVKPIGEPFRVQVIYAAMVAAAPPARSASTALGGRLPRFAYLTKARAAARPPHGPGRRRQRL
jgi:hypothetical protein